MISVLHVIDTTGPGGAETVFCTLADGLRDRGFRSVVVLRGKGWLYEELRRRGLEPRMIDSKGSFHWPYLRALRRLIRAEGIQLIQSHLLGSNVYAALAGGLTGRPVVAAFHGTVDVSAAERFSALKSFLLRRYVTRYVTVSRNLRDSLARQGLLDVKRTSIIYNGVDLARFARNRHRRLVVELGLSSDAILVGALGNVRPAKAYDVLINAASRVCSKHPRLHFVVAGDSRAAPLEQLRTLARQLGVDRRVHFIGFREDVPEYLAGLDVFVLSSISEGFSIATIEALASHLPVVATRSGGPEEIVEDGRTGLLVDAADPNALAAGLDRLLEDERLRQVLGSNARAAVEARFNLVGMMDAYARLYNELCQGSQRVRE